MIKHSLGNIYNNSDVVVFNIFNKIYLKSGIDDIFLTFYGNILEESLSKFALSTSNVMIFIFEIAISYTISVQSW